MTVRSFRHCLGRFNGFPLSSVVSRSRYYIESSEKSTLYNHTYAQFGAFDFRHQGGTSLLNCTG